MLKFPPVPSRNKSMSYTNGCISEYLSCRIFASLGFKTQETLLGTYTDPRGKEKIVVACGDFTEGGKKLIEYEHDLIISLFQGNSDIFLTNLEWIEYRNVLASYDKMAEALRQADEVLKINDDNNIHTAIYSKDNYPKNLMRIENPPALLYYKGANPNKGFEKAIASVGTRKPTQFGFNAINYLIPQWVNEGFAIISGLAAGVDRLSHIACLTNNGKTIAVLAHGLEKVSPAENRKLAEDILSNGGTLLSEYPVGTRAEKYRFVNRNRLIVGLSKVTVAMECEVKSGSMHSVEFAQKQNCPIFCPDPGEKLNNSQTGLKYILDNKIGNRIKSGMDYKNVIYAAGYEINNPTLMAPYIKQQYLKAILHFIENDDIKIHALEKLKISYQSKFTNMSMLYNYLMDLIQESIYTLDEIISIFVSVITANYVHDEEDE